MKNSSHHTAYYTALLTQIEINQLADSNSLRKRTSFSENILKSATWYFRFVMRSTPNPNA